MLAHEGTQYSTFVSYSPFNFIGVPIVLFCAHYLEREEFYDPDVRVRIKSSELGFDITQICSDRLLCAHPLKSQQIWWHNKFDDFLISSQEKILARS